MYKKISFKKQSVSMNRAKERKRLESSAPDYPMDIPYHRKTIIYINYDFGKEMHILNLYKTKRIDCYDVYCDGELWKKKIGMSRILEGIRKSSPRIKDI